MSINTIVDGVTYAVPENSERGWGTEVTNLLVALGDNSLLIKGGSIPLTSDADFGPNFGLVSIYYKSRSANISSSGVLRLANTDSVTWRNGANSADLAVTIASDRLQYEGSDIVLIDSTDTLTNKTITDAVLSNNVTGDALETDLSVSSSALKLATADAIKTYVDTTIGDVEAAELDYNPTAPANWDGLVPTNVGGALDTLAAQRALTSVTITGTGSLTGGGDLSSNRTIDISDGGVDTTELADSAVTTVKLDADAVTNAKLADNAVETANITDANVTSAKLESDITLPGTGGSVVPAGTTAQRGASTAGRFRFNTDTSEYEGYDGTSWNAFGTATVNIVNPNLMINGSLDNWQRGTGFTSTNLYGPDRIYINGGTNTSVTRITAGADVPTIYGLRMGQVSTTTWEIHTALERKDTEPLHGKYVTVSFWVRSQGSFDGDVNILLGRNTTEARNPGDSTYGTTDITSSISTSWTRVEATTNAVIGTSDQAFCLSIRRLNQTAAGSNFLEIAGIKIEEGQSATDWRHFGNAASMDLVGCERYYQKSYEVDTIPGTITDVGAVYFSGVFNVWTSELTATMRATPTVTAYSPTNGQINRAHNRSTAANVTPTIANQNQKRFSITNLNTSGQHYYMHWIAEAEL